MTQTTNYQLPQWDASDRVKRSDFNAAMTKIDTRMKANADAAAGAAAAAASANAAAEAAAESAAEALAAATPVTGACTVVTGTYNGTGKYGSANKMSLTFPKPPIAVFFRQVADESNQKYYTLELHNPETRANVLRTNDTDSYVNGVEWNGNTVSWYSISSASAQLNAFDLTYRYIAFLGE